MQVASGCSVFGRADARIVVAAPAPCLPGRNSALLWRSCVRRAQTRARAASEPDRAPSGGGAGAGTVTSNSSPTGNPAVALPPGSNPLELLRVTRDVRTRAALMGEVMRDGNMSRYSAVYDPSPAEAVLAQELGQWPYNVMLFAVANPSLAALDVAKQLRPSLLSLRAAGLDQGDAWFLVTKRLELLANPLPLQRWLDLLSAHGLGSRELSNFLLRMPESLLCDTTQAQALQVISFLRSLGVRQEHLFSRILCGCPAILGRDVDTELTPLLDALAHLGVAPAAAARLACAHPELLMAEPDAHVARLARYLRGIGASDNQIAALLHEVPHALSGEPEELFGRRVAALAVLGIEGDALRAVVRGSALFLTAAGAPQEQIDLLCGPLGYSKEQATVLVSGCPALLGDRPLELQRKAAYLQQHLNMELGDLLSHPAFLGASLMQVIGPRHAFVISRGLEAKLLSAGGACSSSAVRSKGGAFGWNLTALVSGEDVDFVDTLGASVNEYEGFRTAFEEEYAARLSADAAKEFQDELRRLGIYEGDA